MASQNTYFSPLPFIYFYLSYLVSNFFLFLESSVVVFYLSLFFIVISLIYFCIDGFVGVICTSGPLYLTVQCALLDQPLVLLRMRYFQDQISQQDCQDFGLIWCFCSALIWIQAKQDSLLWLFPHWLSAKLSDSGWNDCWKMRPLSHCNSCELFSSKLCYELQWTKIAIKSHWTTMGKVLWSCLGFHEGWCMFSSWCR